MSHVVFDGTPRTRIDIRAATGAMDGEASAKGSQLVHTHIHTYIHVHTHTHTHTNIHAHRHVHTHGLYIHT